jgi:putative cell wall-binding protein
MVCGKQSKPFKNRFVIFVIVKIFNNFMQTVVLQSDSKTDLKLLIDLAKKIGIEIAKTTLIYTETWQVCESVS